MICHVVLPVVLAVVALIACLLFLANVTVFWLVNCPFHVVDALVECLGFHSFLLGCVVLGNSIPFLASGITCLTCPFSSFVGFLLDFDLGIFHLLALFLLVFPLLTLSQLVYELGRELEVLEFFDLCYYWNDLYLVQWFHSPLTTVNQ